MSDKLTSLDEFLGARKDFVKSGDVLIKASRAASSWNTESRSMRFTMSAEVEDRDRDIVYQAGLNIDEFMKNPVGFFNHRSYGRPHGLWSDVERVLTGRPKRTEGTFTAAPEGHNQDADDLAADMGAGLIRTCSIGFRPKAVKKRAVPDDKRDAPYYWPGYEILEAELLECSPCTIPANPAALAKSATAGNKMARELIEEVLDNWAKNPVTGLIVPRSEFEGAHKGATGRRTTIVVVGSDMPVKEIEEAVAKALENEAPADADTTTTTVDESSQPTPTDDPAPQDDAAPPPVVTTEPEAMPPADDKKAQAKSLFQKIIDLFGGEENQAEIEKQLREQNLADAEQIAALASRKEALNNRLAALDERLGAKDQAA